MTVEYPAMSEPNVTKYIVKCYRQTPGDAGCGDVPAFVEDGEEHMADMLEQVGHLLLAFHDDENRPENRKPLFAHLEDEQGHIAARIRIAGPGRVERVSH